MAMTDAGAYASGAGATINDDNVFLLRTLDIKSKGWKQAPKGQKGFLGSHMYDTISDNARGIVIDNIFLSIQEARGDW
ncbi:hypothetical protein AMTR_s00046p00062190 [Amborella trichopoda]|uniref:Uncharacterized protein n=1 Tax=Amborella trichopoda TaxID=13333 RepID=U5D934_AMBTC|nr:hypothetical protein AMTR_s00046p00062190 [Amborella trichopoda]